MRQAISIRELGIKALALGSNVSGFSLRADEMTPADRNFLEVIQAERGLLTQEAIVRCNASPRFEQLWKHIGLTPSDQLGSALRFAVFNMTEASLLRLAKATDTVDFVTFDQEFRARMSGSAYGNGDFDNAVSWYIHYIWNTSLDSRLSLLRNPEVQVVAERFRFPWIEMLEDVDGGVQTGG